MTRTILRSRESPGAGLWWIPKHVRGVAVPPPRMAEQAGQGGFDPPGLPWVPGSRNRAPHRVFFPFRKNRQRTFGSGGFLRIFGVGEAAPGPFAARPRPLRRPGYFFCKSLLLGGRTRPPNRSAFDCGTVPLSASQAVKHRRASRSSRILPHSPHREVGRRSRHP